jgi:hypothetical protein
MLIDWSPLRATPVALPPGAAFVVANSLAPSLKAETADRRCGGLCPAEEGNQRLLAQQGLLRHAAQPAGCWGRQLPAHTDGDERCMPLSTAWLLGISAPHIAQRRSYDTLRRCPGKATAA